jgi:hypothetical protein
MARRWLDAALGLLLIGGGAAAAPGGSTGSAGPVTLKLADGGHVLSHQRAYISDDDMLTVELSDQPIPTRGSPAGRWVRIRLPAGPGRGYFAGGEIATPVSIFTPPGIDGNVVPGYRTRMTIAPFQAKVGERVRGVVSFDGDVVSTAAKRGFERITGGGAFDAPLTLVMRNVDATAPTTTTAGPVAGTFEDAKFTLGSTIVTFSVDIDRTPYIDGVWFLARKNVGCDGLLEARNGHHLLVTTREVDFGGSGMAPIIGRPLPVAATYHYGNDSWTTYGFGANAPSWLRFDAITLKEGAVASGAVFAASVPGLKSDFGVRPGHLEGTFEARVCKRRPDPVLPAMPAMPAP